MLYGGIFIMKNISGGVTSVTGFKAYGLRAGIKAGKTNRDMAMIYTETPAVCAGVFTTNKVKAGPVKWDSYIVENFETVNAVVINTGIANACTGQQGYDNAKRMSEYTAEVLGLEKAEQVLSASTGVIGKQLPMDIIEKGIKELAPMLSNTEEAGDLAAEAILTTDTRKKQYSVQFDIDGKTVTIGGMCKGSGMIHPNMGTMLAFVCTDIAIDKKLLQEALKSNVENTFNMISVDGDTSTNDSLFVLANGLAGNTKITEKNDDYKKFCEALNAVNTYLAQRIAEDGEGATKLFEVIVENAPSKKDAKILSKAVITSNLTKAAVFGSDANFGRILCAMGYSGAEFNPDTVTIQIESANGKTILAENGMPADFSEEQATSILSADKVTARIDVKCGTETATAWGCDLTHEYVSINADYRS
jgi:glutamate N-acetyltransferase/amino-acid N-acetyltransferase